MNPIRFRAWDKVRKKMGKVVAMDWDHYDNIVTAHIEYYDGTVMKTYPEDTYGDQMVFMQDTGIKDYANKSIYEGDIVTDGRVHIIVGSSNGRYTGTVIGDGLTLTLVDFSHTHTFKIIGDIYQNPKLLEVEE